MTKTLTITPEQRAIAQARGEARVAAGLSFNKTPIEKAIDNPKSMRAAINAMCYDCIGQDADPDWRGSIRNCICNKCPLYILRPHQRSSLDSTLEI